MVDQILGGTLWQITFLKVHWADQILGGTLWQIKFLEVHCGRSNSWRYIVADQILGGTLWHIEFLEVHWQYIYIKRL